MTPNSPSLARWSPLSRIAGEGAERSEAGEGTTVASIRQSSVVAYLEALPLAVVFLLFFVVPIALVVVVSFFGYETYRILIPAFTLDNYREVFSEAVTYRTYLITVKFCVIVWAITSVLGFFIAYFLAFQLRSRTSQTVLLLICSIPFWTSIVIRMIAWIPLLGRNGLVNRSLLGIGVVDGPQEWLLYSEFAVILGYVHLYTLMMIVPIFNSMMRIDRSLIEAATDAGASTSQVLWTVILPLSKTGIAIGSIFVIAMVMGDFVTVDVLGGGQVASVGKQIATQLSYLQFPPAAANAMVLLAGGRRDDCPSGACRRHPQGAVRMHGAARPPIFYGLAALFGLFVVFLYGPIATVVVLAFQGPEGGLVFPMNGVSLHWFGELFRPQSIGDIWGSFDRSIALGAIVMSVTVMFSFLAGLAFRQHFTGATTLFYVVIASLVMPSVVVSLGIGAMFEMLGIERAWYSSALGAHLTWTLPFGLLIMLAVFNRFNPAYEEAARDLGAGGWQSVRHVVVPIIAPSLVGVALFGFTLSYDEIARTSQSVGALNTLPLELEAMQTNATTPVIYALGAMTTCLSLLVIGACLLGVIAVRRRRERLWFGRRQGGMRRRCT